MPATYDSICLKENPGQTKTNLHVRSTEMYKLYGQQPGDSDFHRQIVFWFNVCKMPRLYADEKLAPKRAISGQALWDYIGKRMGITAHEVRLYLGE